MTHDKHGRPYAKLSESAEGVQHVIGLALALG